MFEHADPQVRPQDDLFGHVNGKWLAKAEIPPDLPMIGGFIDLVLEAEAQVRDILEDAASASAPSTDAQRIGDLYASFMDEAGVESRGVGPIAADLAAIAAVDDPSALATLMGRLGREGAGGVVEAYVHTDDRDSDRYVVNIAQGGLGMPDESYYREPELAEIREQYVRHVAAMFRLLGRTDGEATAAATAVMAIETRLAAGHWDRVASRDVIATYHLMSLEELEGAAPNFGWRAWLGAMGGDATGFAEVVVRQPSYLPVLSDAWAELPLDDWKHWLTLRVVSAAAPYLSSEFAEEAFAFHGRVLTGADEQRERWRRGVALCDGAVGEAVGRAYVERHFPPAAKAQMDVLVANLVEAYRVSIGQLEWMGPDTRERALTKLGMFRSKIGFPDRWRDYGTLEVRRDDLMGNVRRAAAFETDRELGKLGGPVDRDEWYRPPQTVNAYYNPGNNEICFPAAILQPPFFDPAADAALNYGGIGAVIGHEIGHGFDDQGSEYDGEGNLVNWWTDDDRTRFQERTDRLVTQYDGFEPRALPGDHVNGSLTLGENIGDLGGLTIALLAYEISLGGVEPPVIDGLTGRQRLLQNWANVWRVKARPEFAKQMLTVDPHSPPEFRANIVRNLDEFHEAYTTTLDDDLWLEPEDRVRIW